jgi:hypothetical protein
VSVVLAVAFPLIAVSVYLPPRAATTAQAALLLAIVFAVVIWVAAQALGGILASGATDPNSGPLLVLLALAYWPTGATPGSPAARSSASAVAEGSLG